MVFFVLIPFIFLMKRPPKNAGGGGPAH